MMLRGEPARVINRTVVRCGIRLYTSVTTISCHVLVGFIAVIGIFWALFVLAVPYIILMA